MVIIGFEDWTETYCSGLVTFPRLSEVAASIWALVVDTGWPSENRWLNTQWYNMPSSKAGVDE
jgi:hypothetical protein